MKSSWLNSLLSGVFAIFAMVTAAAAANVLKINRMSGDEITTILLEGDIKAGDMNELLSIQSEITSSKTLLLLNSAGGDAREGLMIAKFVHNQHWSTAAIFKSQCYSACATIWIAGEKKLLSADAVVGFHDVYTEEKQPSAPGNAIVGAFYGQLGLSDRVIQYLTSAPPDKFNPVNLEIASAIGLDVIDYDKLPSDSKDGQPSPSPPSSTQTSSSEDSPVIVEAPLNGPIPSPQPVQPPEQTSFVSFDRTDIVGHDIVGAATKTFSAEECVQICSSRNDCVAYTYDGRLQMCYPKNGGRLKLPNIYATSGARQTVLSELKMSSIALQSKSRLAGVEYKVLRPSLIGDCVEQCDLDGSCQSLNYQTATNTCLLFNSVPFASSTRGWLSGVKN